jgi:ArsR family transcriptional regulator
VCHLEAALGQRQAYISQHLMVLREAGLVQDRREASRVYYRVTEPRLYAVLDAARACTGTTGPAPDPSPAGCDCPECQSLCAASGI